MMETEFCFMKLRFRPTTLCKDRSKIKHDIKTFFHLFNYKCVHILSIQFRRHAIVQVYVMIACASEIDREHVGNCIKQLPMCRPGLCSAREIAFVVGTSESSILETSTSSLFLEHEWLPLITLPPMDFKGSEAEQELVSSLQMHYPQGDSMWHVMPRERVVVCWTRWTGQHNTLIVARVFFLVAPEERSLVIQCGIYDQIKATLLKQHPARTNDPTIHHCSIDHSIGVRFVPPVEFSTRDQVLTFSIQFIFIGAPSVIRFDSMLRTEYVRYDDTKRCDIISWMIDELIVSKNKQDKNHNVCCIGTVTDSNLVTDACSLFLKQAFPQLPQNTSFSTITCYRIRNLLEMCRQWNICFIDSGRFVHSEDNTWLNILLRGIPYYSKLKTSTQIAAYDHHRLTHLLILSRLRDLYYPYDWFGMVRKFYVHRRRLDQLIKTYNNAVQFFAALNCADIHDEASKKHVAKKRIFLFLQIQDDDPASMTHYISNLLTGSSAEIPNNHIVMASPLTDMRFVMRTILASGMDDLVRSQQ